MADQDPRSPQYDQTEVITDPHDELAVQIPEGLNDGSDPGQHILTRETPNEVLGGEPTEVHSEPAVPAPHDEPGVKPNDVQADTPAKPAPKADKSAPKSDKD